MFKKGHKGYNGPRSGSGRKKPIRRNLTENNTTGRENLSNKNKNQAIDKFPITKKWDTSSRYKQLDPELVDYYIYNDLDVTELFEGLKNYRESEDERDNENM
jgi:hypothetical protein